MPQVLKPLCRIPFSHFLPRPAASFLPLSGEINNWTSQYEGRHIMEQNQVNRLQMVQFDCPRYRIPCVPAPAASFLLLSGVIKNWTSQHEGWRGGKFLNKISSTGCKWSNLNAPPQVLKPLCPILFWVNPFFSFSAPAASFLPLSGVIDNWTSQYEGWRGVKFLEPNQLNRLQMVEFECPRY